MDLILTHKLCICEFVFSPLVSMYACVVYVSEYMCYGWVRGHGDRKRVLGLLE